MKVPRKNSTRKGLRDPFQLFGITGYPLVHSLSPAMQEKAFAFCGIRALYLVLEFNEKRVRSFFRNLEKTPLSGFNVTIPYKETVIPYLDRVSREARRIGAVNTVFRKGKRWAGANTDVYGFLCSLKQEARFHPRGKTAVVLGAGGAARAVVYGLALEGAKRVMIFNRHAARADHLAAAFRKQFPKTRFEAGSFDPAALKTALDTSSLVVQATSVGLKASDPSPLPESLIPRGRSGSRKVFFDLIYHPHETRFLKAARKRGHQSLNGVGMLVHQGARAFELWTGKRAPAAVMRQALMTALAERGRD